MRIAIAGAGNVGRSIAKELVDNGHQVMLIERVPRMVRPERVPAAEWILADACELSSLQEADIASCDVVVAATGDDKVNLVVSLLAKTEFAVPRVVARINRAENEWLFNEQWGVDVSVSKPRLMAALVEEAVSVGDLVRLMTFRQSEANLVEITLPSTAPYVGHPVRDVPLPHDSALVAVLRGRRVLVPTPDDPLEAGDELVFVVTSEMEDSVRAVILGEDSVEKTLKASSAAPSARRAKPSAG
jgi:trk system potassium uptake protein TrkA